MAAFSRFLGFRRYASYSLGAFAFASFADLAMISTGVCGAPGRNITIEKEVLLEPGKGGSPYVVTAAKDGDLIVAGTMGEAWATRISSGGQVRWSYKDTVESEFDGAVALSDNSTLLCGFTNIERRGDRAGYLVHVSASGAVLSRQRVFPHDDDQFPTAVFEGCFSWKDGIAVIGGAASRAGKVGWLIKLNDQGIKEWEKIEPREDWHEGTETADHNLVLASREFLPKSGVTVARLNTLGEIIGRRFIECTSFELVRPTFRTDDSYILAIDSPKATLFALDKGLGNMPEKQIQLINLDRGRVYMLADHSLMLFGNVAKGGDAYTAAVAKVEPNSKLGRVHIFRPEFESYSASDGVQISPTQFVTVRDSIAANKPRSGIIVDWISIN